MPADRESPLVQAAEPTLAGPDRRRLVEQPVPLLLPRQPGEPLVQRVAGREERLLAVQDRRVGAGGVFMAVELAGPERELDAAEQGRMRVGREGGVDQVGDRARMPVQLDQASPLGPGWGALNRSRSPSSPLT
jgi:hypothetical protein